VPDVQPLNAAVPPERIGETVQAVADDTARVSTIWSATVRAMMLSLT